MIETLMGMLKNHYHLTGKVGGWIYRSDGTCICQGWVTFAKLIRHKGIILRHHPFIQWDNADRFLLPKEDRDEPLVHCRNCRGGIVDGLECPWCGGTGTVKGIRR